MPLPSAPKTMFSLLPLLLLSLLLPGARADEAAPAPKHEANEDGFVKIFDGKTFDGWEGNLKSFRIQDGAVVGGNLTEKVPRNEFLCSKKEYGDFELRLKCKLVGKDANAGIQFRTRRIPNHHEVSGYQADMGWGWWGALYDESRRNKILAKPDPEKIKKIVKADDWNDYIIRAKGDRIQLWLNGQLTVDFKETDPEDKAWRKGILGLQIHAGPPTESWYKDIRIKELK